jgi:two-component system sensor histidine kinase KdpD
LLNSISHDLQTPLASILGSLDSLRDAEIHLDSETRRGLLLSARDEADRLQRLVGNLLQMTRVEAGAARLTCEFCEVQDLVATALQQVEAHHPGRPIEMDVPQDLRLVRVDFVLFVQVLVNLLENALRYAPPDSPIRIRAFSGREQVHLEVIDHGPGIAPEDRQRVFEKFYRVQPEGRAGTGLGLAICRGLVEAHKGRIQAHETPGGGTTIRVDIPLEGRTA